MPSTSSTRGSAMIDVMTLSEAARVMRDAMRDKSYQVTPLGEEIANYLHVKRKRLTESSHRDYESGLDKLARHFPDLRLEDFEPHAGTERLEEFLDHQWGAGAPRTYNKNLSICKDFFQWQVKRGRLHGDPTLLIERAKSREVYRTTFTTDQRHAIIAGQDSLRDRIALRLLLDYGIRKGALRAIQFGHFDHQRKRVTIFTKGQKIRELPLPDPAFWKDLERHILEVGAQPHHYLLTRRKRAGRDFIGAEIPEEPMSSNGADDGWCRCLEKAGLV